MTVGLRVHFAAVGFEVVRLIDPLRTLHADRVVLFTERRNDKARKYLVEIERLLQEERIPYAVVECDIWSTAVVVDQIAGIITSSPQHQYFVNVSTGAKPACLAGTVAGMLWPVRPYYVPVDYEKPGPIFSEDHPVSGPAEFIPTFEVPLLGEGHFHALRFIVASGGAVPKYALLDHLKELRVVRPRERRRRRVSPQAYQAQVDAILQRLEDWGFVERVGRGRALRIRATEKGTHGDVMFNHVLAPRPPLSLLSS